MKNNIVLLLTATIVLSFCSCGSIPLSQGPSYNNPTYDVSYLFEHEGVKIFRFYDMGHYVYFSHPVSDIYSVKDDSTMLKTQMIAGHKTQIDNTARETSVVYAIEGISTEGAEAKVYYLDSRIKEAHIDIYGETGKTEVAYFFNQNDIDVVETVYLYKKMITDVKSHDDINLEYELKYKIDYDGKRIGVGKQINYTDIFSNFKEVVPFEI